MWLPLGFQEWWPAAQAATLGLLTLLQEDVPTMGAALLAATGRLNWQAGLAGCFLGIWIGDALLYLLARGMGRPLLQSAWARRVLDPAAVRRSERWFSEKGTWILLASRFVPGTRLPTYLAAGFLRLSFARFLAVTGTAVAIWTTGIFALANMIGSDLLRWVGRWNTGAPAILAVLGGLVLIHFAGKAVRNDFRRRVSATMRRWTRWEFWPAWLFYLPVAVNYLGLALRFRGLTLPTAANPGMFSGGFVGESKIAILRDLKETSPELVAEALLLPAMPDGVERRALLESLRRIHNINYPFILKPDVGQRGVGVKLIRTPEQAVACLERSRAPLVLQRYAPGPHEVGVFYYRFPHEKRGCIFAITGKIFPTVSGDGRSSVEELIWRDDRARLIADKYVQRLGDRRFEVPAAGDVVKLVETGNHAQGCIFEDGARLWSEELEICIDAISQKLPGFYIGRYDIRYSDEHDLRAGRNFQIIELNGAAAEATNIYDARNSLLAAYRTLFRQWELVFAIGAANRRQGAAPASLPWLWRQWRRTVALTAGCPAGD